MIAEVVRPDITTLGRRGSRQAQIQFTTDQEWHGHFLSLLPSIRSHAEVCFRHRLPEARAELVQETICRALVDYVGLVERGKQDLAFATPLSCFAVSQVRRGRRVGSRMNRRDALADNSRSRTQLPHDLLEGAERLPSSWLESLTENRHSDPAAIAEARIDIGQWLSSLANRDRHIAELLAAGERTGTVAKVFAITAGRVAQLRRKLETSWLTFQRQAYER